MKRYPSWTIILRRTLLAAAVLATAVAAICFEENLRGDRALRRLARECAEEGKPLDYAFYRPPPIPEALNMYRAAVLARFFNPQEADRTIFNSQEADRPWNAYERGKPPLDKMSDALGNWCQGRRSDLGKIYAVLGKAPPPGPAADPGAAAELVLDTLRGIQPDLDALGAASRERPQSQIPFSPTQLPQFGALRFFTRALALRAVAEIELGRNIDAFNDVYACLRLTEGVERYPHHITLLMANVMASFALQPLWEGCVRGAWNAGQLESFQELLSRLHPLRELPADFAAGRAAYEAGYLTDSRRPFWMPEGWWKINVARFFELHAGGGDPLWFDAARERVDLDGIRRADAVVDRLKRSYSPFDWLIRHEAWGTKMTVYASIEHNQFALAGTACALERYRLVHGGYPAGLSELVPGLLESVPRDVIDGAPLRYERGDGARFRLYSMGIGAADDPAWPAKPVATRWATREGRWEWAEPGG